MEWMLYLVASLFLLLGGLCVASIILSLPGAWIMLGLAALIEWVDQFYLPIERQQTFDWRLLGACAALLTVGELLELIAGAEGAKRGGAGRRGMIGALIGGIAGAIAFTPFIPIPIVGTLIGALIGTFAGAVVGETSGAQAKSMRGSVKPAIGATIGRIAGTISKLALAIAVWIVLSVAAFWP
jgi:hypothetical protein